MKHTSDPTKIAIIDDHPTFRQGLITTIEAINDTCLYKIVFEANNGEDLIRKIKEHPLPDIILLDIVMPNLDGYDTVSWLKTNYPNIKILIISMFETEEVILKMIRLNIDGYLPKSFEIEDMQLALESIIYKGVYYSDLVSEIMAEEIKGNKILQNKVSEGLSENQLTFLQLVADGSSYKQIADKMNLSPKTIEGYRDKLFKHFGVNKIAVLIKLAIEKKLVK
jgi:DNA-binding NarL/FixJ family response regulator